MSIDEYVAATGVVPGGVMVYTGVHDFGNVADFDYLLKKYPRCAFQVGLYMAGSLDKVVNGECDALPEQAFYMVGTIEEALEKAEVLRKA